MNSFQATVRDREFFANVAGWLSERVVLWFMRQGASFATSHMRKRMLIVVMGLVVAIASGFSFSQGNGGLVGNGPGGLYAEETPPKPTAANLGKTPMNSGEIVDLVVNSVDSEVNKLKNNATLTRYGDLIAGFFLISLLSWSLVKALATAKGFGDVIADWVPLFVSFGFVYLFLNKSAPNMIEAFVSGIGTAISGMPMNGMGPSVRAVMDPMLGAMFDMINSPVREGTSIWESITMLPAKLGNIITTLLAVLFLVIGLVVSVATVVMSHIAIALAMAMAPVMVPFIMFKPTTWIFDSWVKFTLGAAMMKVVFAFMVKIAAAILAGTTVFRQKLAADATLGIGDYVVADLVVQATIILLCLLAMLILMQTPGIATGLLSGSASGGGFSGLKAFTGGTSGRSSAKGANVAAAGGNKAVGVGANAAMAAGRGAANAWKASTSRPAPSPRPTVLGLPAPSK